MTSDEDYYRGRVAVERDLARHATNPYARRAHQELADNYAILCRLLRPTPIRPARPRPMIGNIEFTTLIQTLATPHSIYLVPVHGGPWQALEPADGPNADLRRMAARPGAQIAINERPSAISPASTAA